jgi:hypothetical protein
VPGDNILVPERALALCSHVATPAGMGGERSRLQTPQNEGLKSKSSHFLAVVADLKAWIMSIPTPIRK